MPQEHKQSNMSSQGRDFEKIKVLVMQVNYTSFTSGMSLCQLHSKQGVNEFIDDFEKLWESVQCSDNKKLNTKL